MPPENYEVHKVKKGRDAAGEAVKVMPRGDEIDDGAGWNSSCVPRKVVCLNAMKTRRDESDRTEILVDDVPALSIYNYAQRV